MEIYRLAYNKLIYIKHILQGNNQVITEENGMVMIIFDFLAKNIVREQKSLLYGYSAQE